LSELRLQRLPYTAQEAEQILRLVPDEQEMKAVGFQATRAAATSTDLSQYQFVHLATHGYFNSARPEMSGLVFSRYDETGKPQNGFLLASDVYNLRLPAEVVVLSACETGLGEEVRGEGLIGLTRGFMYAGAARVIVSLWSISDQATAELMSRFYQAALQNKQSPAAALRAAQLALWRQKRWGRAVLLGGVYAARRIPIKPIGDFMTKKVSLIIASGLACLLLLSFNLLAAIRPLLQEDRHA
jgi:CHAT domain-containing protein